jgi:hypothetical protein
VSRAVSHLRPAAALAAACAAALALALALALAPSAHAAPPWSAPQDLSAPHLFVDAPAIAFGGRGDALATWRAQDGTGNDAVSGSESAARPAGAAAFGAPRALASPRTAAQRPTEVSPPAPYAATRAIVATLRPEDRAGRRLRLAAVFGDTAGRFGVPHTIAVGANLRGAQVAADAAGDAAIAWWEDRGVFDDHVHVALRRPGGSFGRPLLLATDRVRSVSVAVSPRGDVLVAWDARGTIKARIRVHGARGFGAADAIASAPTYYATLRTAMTARGRAYVAWTAQLLTEGGDRGPFYAEAAVRGAGSRRFRAAQLLEREPSSVAQAGVDLAVDGDDAIVAWAGADGENHRIRVVSTMIGARFGAAVEVSPPGADASAPAVAARDGRRLVAWTQGPADTGGAIYAAVSRSGLPFGAPELVSPGPQARVPDAALSPTGVATVVWSNRPAGSGGPLAAIRTYAQAASRGG